MIAVRQAQLLQYRIVLTYMESLVEGRPLQRVVAVCEVAGISRTTFYNHFENMADLDLRFLRVYARLVLDSHARPFSKYEDLRHWYEHVVEAQNDQAGFFRKILTDPALVRYQHRWFEALEAYLLDDYRACFTDPGSRQGRLMVCLATGVVRRYFEWATVEDGAQLSADTDLMLEYLWAGIQMVNRRNAGEWPSTIPAIDQALGGDRRPDTLLGLAGTL